MIRDFKDIHQVAQLLKERQIDVNLLCEFISEAIESHVTFDLLTERLSLPDQREVFKQDFLENLKRFLTLLTEVKQKYPLTSIEFESESEKRLAMKKTVDKFLKLLEE